MRSGRAIYFASILDFERFSVEGNIEDVILIISINIKFHK